MFLRFFYHKTQSVFFAAAWVGIFAFLSRLLGLLRNRLLAVYFGAGRELDIYYAAFRVPDFVFNILVVGAVSSVLVPVFSDFLEKDRKDAERLLNVVANWFVVFLALASSVLFVFAPQIMKIITPGFLDGDLEKAVFLTRIMFLSPLFLGLSSILGSALLVFKKMIAYSLAPIVYNLGIIFSILFLVPFFGVSGLAFGVVLGALCHFLAQFFSYSYSGFKFNLSFDFFHKGIKKILFLATPRIFGVSVSQINVLAITAFASFFGPGGIAAFNFANDFQYLPVGIIAISFSVAVFPAMSLSAAKESLDEFRRQLSETTLQITFLILPISVLFFVSRFQIVSFVLKGGMFSEPDTVLVSATLGFFCFGIFAQSLIPLFTRAFFALQNTLMPVIVNSLGAVLNIALSIYFIWLMNINGAFYRFVSLLTGLEFSDNIGVLGLALAFSVSGILNILFLFLLFHKKFIQLDLKKIFISVGKIFVSTVLMFFVIRFFLDFFDDLFIVNERAKALVQMAAVFFIGTFVYCLCASFLGLEEFFFFKSRVKGTLVKLKSL